MAGSRTGTASIWRYAKKIQKLQATYGASDMTARLGADFTACVNALVACVIAIYGVDNFPLEVDRVAPHGPEDLVP
jgi:hypothetical protein